MKFACRSTSYYFEYDLVASSSFYVHFAFVVMRQFFLSLAEQHNAV